MTRRAPLSRCAGQHCREYAGPRPSAAGQALSEQVGQLIHTQACTARARAELLADRLAAHSGMAEVFFCNSGCEANGRRSSWRVTTATSGHRSAGDHRHGKAFHGRTLATALGDRQPQGPGRFSSRWSAGFIRVPYDDLAAVEAVARNNANVVAVLFEPIRGEGRHPPRASGIHAGLAQDLRRPTTGCSWSTKCNAASAAPALVRHQHAGVLPGMMTLAKGLGSGVPVGACLAAGKAAGVFGLGNHGSTFGGNPLACVAALTTLDVIEAGRLMARADTLGETIGNGLRAALAALRRSPDPRRRA